LLEQVLYSLLLRWWVGLSPVDPNCHPTTHTKNRVWLLHEQVIVRSLEKLMGTPKVKQHFW
jgi:hypothetical protein